MKKTKINNMQDLEREISRLRKLSRERELAINKGLDEIVDNLRPVKLILSGIKSLFSSAESKTIASEGIGFATNLLLGNLLAGRSNFLVKYGLSKMVVNLVSNLVGDKWNPELFKKIKKFLKLNSEEEGKESGSIP